MELIKAPIQGLLIFKPKIFLDERGYFFESWSKQNYKKFGVDVDFFQDNESSSKKGVLRGLHFQNPPFEQGKLVRVIKGAVLDIVVDIRKDSATYGEHFSIKLSDENKKVFWIPPGFAHGFVTLEDDTIFMYKCSQLYNKNSEGSLAWNDPDLNIDWKVENPIISPKDMIAGSFKDFKSQF